MKFSKIKKFSKIEITQLIDGVPFIEIEYRYNVDVARYIQYENETREDVVRTVITPVDEHNIPDDRRAAAEAIRLLNQI